jgi:hypothetical protein
MGSRITRSSVCPVDPTPGGGRWSHGRGLPSQGERAGVQPLPVILRDIDVLDGRMTGMSAAIARIVREDDDSIIIVIESLGLGNRCTRRFCFCSSNSPLVAADHPGMRIAEWIPGLLDSGRRRRPGRAGTSPLAPMDLPHALGARRIGRRTSASGPTRNRPSRRRGVNAGVRRRMGRRRGRPPGSRSRRMDPRLAKIPE